MRLQNIKKDQKGFTIVELLIVIVVIGILAAITIVAFNGIQNRANGTAAESLATDMIKKAEAYNAVKGAYPTMTELSGVTTDPAEAKLDTKQAAAIQAAAPDATNGKTKVGYVKCTSGGIRVTWWNFAASPAIATVKTAGDVTTCP